MYSLVMQHGLRMYSHSLQHGLCSVLMLTLVITGVRLESKQCEALEEVFRRVSVNMLNLDSCGLEDDVRTVSNS